MECWLISKEGSHDPIKLVDNTELTIGRSPLTRIIDSKISRQHAQLTADYSKKQVKIKQLGTNSCYVDGCPIQKEDTIEIKCGKSPKVLNLLQDKYPYQIEFSLKEEKTDKPSKRSAISDFFKPVSNKDVQKSRGVKRKSEPNISDLSPKSKVSKTEDGFKKDSDSESDSDQETKKLKEKLIQMKAEFKRTEAAATPLAAKKKSENVRNTKPLEKYGEASREERWEEHGKLLMFTSLGVKASYKVAAFDIDSTIICTQSGKVFATHAGDWKIMLSETPGRLKKLKSEGYKIVFFTNQAGIQRGKVKVPEYRNKVENIIKKLGIPVQVFVSTGAGPYRKPGLGMWNFLCQRANDGIEIDVEESIYIGDAAGRPVGWAPGKKKDFSCSDRLFAINAGLKFYTPEEYFLGHKKAAFNLPEFNPGKIAFKKLPDNIVSSTQEVIVNVGFPASGKSFFFEKHLKSKGYMCVNRDTLKTWQKCVEMTKKHLKKEKSTDCDNTNPDPDSRKRYVDCAKAAGISCRCFVFTTTLTQCRHNERFREMTDKSHQPINDMIMNSYKSKFVEPLKSEGFTDILKIDFVPKFTNKEHEKIYTQYLLEK